LMNWRRLWRVWRFMGRRRSSSKRCCESDGCTRRLARILYESAL